MFTTTVEIFPNEVNKIEEVKSFLHAFDLKYEMDIDYTIAVYDQEKLIATASKAGNVLKCFAVLENYQGEGISNSLVKQIEDRMFKEGLYHFFIYTTSCNKAKFLSIGYQEVITSQDITILENGNKSIKRFLTGLKLNNQITDEPKACIVMNANPFTLGHRYLIEKASNEHQEVLVFIVSEERSTFPFEVRMRLVKEGVKDFSNVTVVETGPYLISNATFPTYFLKSHNNVMELQTKIDCDIFLTHYKPMFNITTRYIGQEPYCEVTSTYNQVMKATLPKGGVMVKEVARIANDGDIISASKVRSLLKYKQFETLKPFVPKSTYQYLKSEDAKTIINDLQSKESRH